MGFALWVKQPIDGRFAFPVPDLLEPLVDKGSVCFRHGEELRA